MASKGEVEVEITSSADKFWAAITDSTALFPKIFPQQYKSIEVVEGDGKSPGSVRIIHYAEGLPSVKFAKEKIELADNTKRLITYSVIDGDLLNFYKSFRPTLEVSPRENGALVKWSVEYEKVNDEVPAPDLIQDLVALTFKDLDVYLLKN